MGRNEHQVTCNEGAAVTDQCNDLLLKSLHCIKSNKTQGYLLEPRL